ncbi:disease resistance protein (TIR-NBS-LRR class) [Medicago truncatula]|uniref:Disease resistance protein (TIR-NBS-LRR class) n=1 Tax=Medicago truncatula TaxID=3880 RepID=A0A072U342_MEDTR|nr:disease resistance protein (TIR-NBS-LRR class) [Medicago truncatula]
MASSGSSSISNNDINPSCIYDVFLSFCDKDTSESLASYLYTALTVAGIVVYKDEDKLLNHDQMITSSVLHAIAGSRLSIIVFSKLYAVSTCCRQELEKIMECRRTTCQIVVPVFYDADPSGVFHQEDLLGEASKYLKQRILKKDKLIHEVCNISGFAVHSRNESEDIMKIVDHVTNLLDRTDLFVADHPVGVKSRVQDIIQLLNSQESKSPLLLGVWGMGGIGKTTIAKAAYNKIHHDFEAKSFLPNVREVWEQDNGVVSLQQQLLSDIYKTTKIKIDTVESGKMILQERLRHKRIFLVLDDVNKLDQLNALCGSHGWFGEGSRIIITTRDDDLLGRLKVHYVYRMKEMDSNESLELFSWHAFKQPIPIEGFGELSTDVVKYSRGLPLALQVIGSFLLTRRRKKVWKRVLEKLTKPDDKIQEVLKLIFDNLSDNIKETFLDIACLNLSGMSLDDLLQIFQKDVHFTELGMEELVINGLVNLDSEKRIGMHDLVQLFGREIRQEKSTGMAAGGIYDVFLSFRGDDTHAKFISHLYTALENAGIYVFRGDDEIQRELENIMGNSRTQGMVVVPVFYKIDPTEVRNQSGRFGEDFESLLLRMSVDTHKFSNWRRALAEVRGTTGVVIINSRNESEDITKIVDHVTNLLDRTDFFVVDHPVGVDSRVQDVIQLLNGQESKDPRLLGIWGMGGIGKTTIAKAAYNKIHRDFEAKSFLLNVREVWEQDNGIVSLQQRLLSDIYKTTKIKIETVESGKMILQERLCHKRIFLVLDDVNKLDQLNALCGSHGWFGEGSRIIITTRDDDLLGRLKVHYVYRMKEMDSNESLELFSWHVFKQPIPIEGFGDLSTDVVKYSGGSPLALEVIGSFLLTRRSKKEWKSILEKLTKPDVKLIPDMLRLSFDNLSDNIKETFLDIACLNLSGMSLDDLIQIFKKDVHFKELGMEELVTISLVQIDSEKRIERDDLLQLLGREIRKEKSTAMAAGRIYDVFLSFRGNDTRAKFISHLYTALENAGIYVFRDDDEIQRGDQISASLLQAIEQSKISIVVLSRSYADSRWCMLELENIMGNSRTQGMVVVPVFYEIDPSEVRNQSGKFGEDFESLLLRTSVDTLKLSNWKTALAEVGGTAGVVIINSRNESEDIRKIVDHVTNLPDRTDLFVADHPVGVDSRVQDVIQLLNNQESKDPLLLGIWGMGGIGKTTIAKAAYNKIRHDFEAKSFLLNVREVWEQDNGVVSLQQRLLSDIYKTTKIKIETVESGKMILQERLRHKRIFLVLDDVNKVDQLNALCGSHEWFGEGSRIMITTRDDDLLSRLKVDYVYRMKEMDGNESLELFSWHAFKQPIPIEGFGDLSTDVVMYSGGLPIALQVIGSFLLTRRRKKEWKSVLEKLKLIPNDEVLEKLKISFDGLSDDDVKEIFLDIAFFFIGMDQEEVTTILEGCGHFADIGISLLVQKSLVTVDRKNKIGMHDLLRDMGREIVRKKSIEISKEPSRLWRYEDVDSVLSKATRALDVKGLTLKMSRMDSRTYMETKDFEKINKLKFLQLAGVQLEGNYKYLSRDIRWLCWHGFPLKYTPEEFHQEHLVAVDLKYSHLEQVWKKSQLLKELKFLNLSHSHNLKQTPDFSYLPNLEKLILKDCPNLSSVSPNIGNLKKILLINLKDCTGLCELPRSIYKLKSVKTLIVSGCTKIDKLEEDIEQMTSLTILVADKTSVTRVPFAVVRSKSIGFISLCGFEGFARNVFPSIIQSWMSPTNGILPLVQTFAGTSSLEFFDEQDNSFYGLPSFHKDLPNLQRLWFKCKSEAQLNQTLASILDNLHTKSCEELEAMQNTAQSSKFVTSASTHCCSQVPSSSSQNSLTSLFIQIGMNCRVTNTLKENIFQKMPPNGSGLLPGDNYPDWLAFNDNGSSVTFEVPKVDGRSLKTIMCTVYSSSPGDITSEGLKVLLVINCTKNTIQLHKSDALLASFDEEEWQKVVSNTEPGDIVNVTVVFENKFIVKKTTVYLVYDEPNDIKAKPCLESDGNVSNNGLNYALLVQII